MGLHPNRGVRVTIEKAFAIHAEPVDIWNALWHDLGEGDQNSFAVESSRWPHGFTLRLELAGLPVLLSYSIDQKPEHCEVAARIEPLSRRYSLYQLLTFGHLRRNYEMLLVQGLVNLKQAVEPSEGVESEELVEDDA
jgi:hypothetical protein